MMEETLRLVCERLVGDSDLVTVTCKEDDGIMRVLVYVKESHIGKVIGRQGRTARALRVLAQAAAPQGVRRVMVDIEPS